MHLHTILGRPVWYELMTTDTKAAETFYKKVVGWTSAPFDGSPKPYTQFKRSGDVAVAGLMKRPDGMNMPPFWAMYVGVPKLEDAVAHIKRLGGSELSPVIDVPTVGRMQMMKDPQGAAFYIIQPEPREQAPDGAPEVGEASWHELMTTDAPAAMKFYSEVFGWQPSEAMDMGPMGKYQMFNRAARHDRRHDEQAARDGAGAAALADLLPRARHQRRRRAHQGERRQDPQRADGGAGRRLDRERDGSAGRVIRVARPEDGLVSSDCHENTKTRNQTSKFSCFRGIAELLRCVPAPFLPRRLPGWRRSPMRPASVDGEGRSRRELR